MYVHLGNNFIIAGEKIIAVLNYAAPVSEDVKEIVEIAELEKKMVNISNNGKEKAVVVCDESIPVSYILCYPIKKSISSL
jgi:regulator of extracellular matrix RemA (YlzA/DUF370 family)